MGPPHNHTITILLIPSHWILPYGGDIITQSYVDVLSHNVIRQKAGIEPPRFPQLPAKSGDKKELPSIFFSDLYQSHLLANSETKIVPTLKKTSNMMGWSLKLFFSANFSPRPKNNRQLHRHPPFNFQFIIFKLFGLLQNCNSNTKKRCSTLLHFFHISYIKITIS